MDNNSAITIALITAISAIIAPLITAIVTSCTEYKLKKTEITFTTKAKAIQAFTQSYAKLSTSESWSYSADLQQNALNLAVLCKKTYTKSSLLRLSDLIMKDRKRTDKSDVLYEHCIKCLFKET